MKNGNKPAYGWSAQVAPNVEVKSHGLIKRELFAAMAMQGIIGSISSEAEYQRLRGLASNEHLKVSEWIARDAVKQADALLAELELTS